MKYPVTIRVDDVLGKDCSVPVEQYAPSLPSSSKIFQGEAVLNDDETWPLCHNIKRSFSLSLMMPLRSTRNSRRWSHLPPRANPAAAPCTAAALVLCLGRLRAVCTLSMGASGQD